MTGLLGSVADSVGVSIGAWFGTSSGLVADVCVVVFGMLVDRGWVVSGVIVEVAVDGARVVCVVVVGILVDGE